MTLQNVLKKSCSVLEQNAFLQCRVASPTDISSQNIPIKLANYFYTDLCFGLCHSLETGWRCVVTSAWVMQCHPRGTRLQSSVDVISVLAVQSVPGTIWLQLKRWLQFMVPSAATTSVTLKMFCQILLVFSVPQQQIVFWDPETRRVLLAVFWGWWL